MSTDIWIFEYSNKMNNKYYLYSYLWFFPDPNIFKYSFDKFFSIWTYLDICLINSWAFKYIQIFFGPIACAFLPYADHCWPIWTILDQFEPVWTCFIRDTQLLLIKIIIKWTVYIKHIHICGFSSVRVYSDICCQILGIQIYLDICLVISLASKYIQIFVRSILGNTNMFG